MERSLGKCSYCYGLMLSAALAAPGAALAADNGFYVGLASSDVSSDYDFGTAAIGDADDDRGFKGIVGFRPLDAFAIEANYVDFGETTVPLGIVCVTTPCPNEETIDSQAVSVSAVGMYALPLVDLYARVGYSKWESEISPFFPEKREGSDPTYGAGAQVRLGSFALRLEYERFDFDDDSAELVSIGFTYTFL
jgi:OmpA-OmpF porin, OOP family